MVTDRYSLYNGNGQLMTNEGNFEEVAEFKYLGTIITNRNETNKEIKHRLNSGNALQGLLSFQLLSKNIKLIYKTVILPVILYGCETWTEGRE